jgi:hypothetical protein
VPRFRGHHHHPRLRTSSLLSLLFFPPATPLPPSKNTSLLFQNIFRNSLAKTSLVRKKDFRPARGSHPPTQLPRFLSFDLKAFGLSPSAQALLATSHVYLLLPESHSLIFPRFDSVRKDYSPAVVIFKGALDHDCVDLPVDQMGNCCHSNRRRSSGSQSLGWQDIEKLGRPGPQGEDQVDLPYGGTQRETGADPRYVQIYIGCVPGPIVEYVQVQWDAARTVVHLVMLPRR